MHLKVMPCMYYFMYIKKRVGKLTVNLSPNGNMEVFGKPPVQQLELGVGD